MQKFIVKSYEEDCGEQYFVLEVPDDVPFAEIEKKVQMAKKYAERLETFYDDDGNIEFELGIKEYDEHYERMFDIYHTYQGQYVFEDYIVNICGWKIVDLVPDFTYMW